MSWYAACGSLKVRSRGARTRQACFREMVLAPTEVPKALATSLAPAVQWHQRGRGEREKKVNACRKGRTRPAAARAPVGRPRAAAQLRKHVQNHRRLVEARRAAAAAERRAPMPHAMPKHAMAPVTTIQTYSSSILEAGPRKNTRGWGQGCCGCPRHGRSRCGSVRAYASACDDASARAVRGGRGGREGT